uniref:Putative aminopeptidase n n=1 Tax=Toxoplasma gondii COUG TaxID=1074873 RepID=A0A2G8Y9B3_TOXGO|nr:putative aminopeptidase n [Toxoplasma gondii COUG]
MVTLSATTMNATVSPCRISGGVSSRLCGWGVLSFLLASVITVQVSRAGEEKEEPKAVVRLDYKPPNFYLEDIVLDFNLDDEDTTVEALLTLYRRAGTEPMNLVLDGDESVILKSISLATTSSPSLRGQGRVTFTELDGQMPTDSQFQFRIVDGNLMVSKFLLPREAEVRFYIRTLVSINPKANLALFGLYKAGDIFVTLNEPSGFRRITYGVDRPDVLATYTVTVTAPRHLPILLSNGDKVLSGYAGENRHFAKFVDPFPKPSYLFALVAGDFASVSGEFVTMSGRSVTVTIYAQHHQRNQLQWALRSLLRAMRWDEETFGREYQYSEFRVLCVEVFNPGAMENTSLNIFTCSLLLADPKLTTDADHRLIVDVVSHEYFHNWTGNRVTVQDWFQLTLKEGLTMFRNNSFTEETTSRAMKRIGDVADILSIQFREDSGPFAHPIRPETYKSIENLYTRTVYLKGAEVNRMYRTMLGPKGFRRGMDLYFKRHDGKAVTCDDLRAAMADANDKDLSQFERWYSQAGTPHVTVSSFIYDAAERKMHLTLKQHTPPTPGQDKKLPLQIPVAVGCIGKTSKRDVLSPPTQILELTEEEQAFVLVDVGEDCVLSVLRDFSAPVKLIQPLQTDEDLAFLVTYDSDNVNRWQAAQTLSRKVLLTRISEYQQRVEEIEEGRVSESDLFSKLPTQYVQTVRDIVIAPESSMGKDIKSLLLSLPTKAQLELAVDSIDPDAINAALASVRRDIVDALGEEMLQLYTELTLPAGTEESGADIEHWGRRALRNELLRFLTASFDQKSAKLASAHFDRAMVMSDKVAALTVLTEIPGQERDEAFERFHQEVAGNAVLMEKWMSLQAMSAAADTLERVAQLRQHSAFHPFIPGSAYSLFGTFSSSSPQFHSKTGAGYALVLDFLMMIDEHNSLVSSRIAGVAFANWKRFTSPRREMLKEVLKKLLKKEKLSVGLKEVLEKALAGEDD